MSHFADDLRDLINRKCRENGSNTPDFVLGEFLWRCLDAFDAAVRERDCFHHLHPTITKVARPLKNIVSEQTSTNNARDEIAALINDIQQMSILSFEEQDFSNIIERMRRLSPVA